jgi:hypothetical protein
MWKVTPTSPRIAPETGNDVRRTQNIIRIRRYKNGFKLCMHNYFGANETGQMGKTGSGSVVIP